MEAVTYGPRYCANCGAVTNGAWWCSAACKREEDGPEWGEQDDREDEREEDNDDS